jgi:hypothetical protein
MSTVVRQWDTDWFDQFKSIFPTNFTNLQIHPGDPLSWINKVPIPFGNKQAQRAFRTPDQRVQVAFDIEYKDKDATRVVQTADMPAIFDSLRIDEEYYAGDVVNAVGHVGDLFANFNDALAQYTYVGTTDPLSYGVLDPGTNPGTLIRPEACTAATTAGAWTTPANMYEDFASMEAGLIDKGFFGPKLLLAPTRVKPYLNAVMTSTTAPYKYWINEIAGMPVIFSEWADADATKDAFDVHMVDSNCYDLHMTPMSVRGFFDNNTEDFVWHWKTRAYLLVRGKHDGTEWKKPLIKCTVDWDG